MVRLISSPSFFSSPSARLNKFYLSSNKIITEFGIENNKKTHNFLRSLIQTYAHLLWEASRKRIGSRFRNYSSQCYATLRTSELLLQSWTLTRPEGPVCSASSLESKQNMNWTAQWHPIFRPLGLPPATFRTGEKPGTDNYSTSNTIDTRTSRTWYKWKGFCNW